MAGDLHTHTNFSDASSDIETLPLLAARAGMTHLAVSDHDTVLAINYANEHKTQNGVQLIPAVELTGFDAAQGERVHILCYYPRVTKELVSFCALMAQRRNEAVGKSLAEIEQLYPQFKREDALKYAQKSGVLFKTCAIRVLFDYACTDGIYKDLYKQLFGKNGTVLHNPAYESVADVLKMARGTGGVIVIAHPSVYHSMPLVRRLAASGEIDGVEINHPRNTAEDKKELAEIAKKYNLIVTGGSDFHGMYSAKPNPLGSFTTDDENIARIQKLAL
ncbi:MAG: PHP domain-containing protein [Clostridia bacterium]|nr:PHP domain-containing protein [Clostridia bacterium]NLS84864.1 PHP domain-containing protein [Oscillospiraceae bacterium]